MALLRIAVLLVCLCWVHADAGVIVAQPAVVSNQTSAVLHCNITTTTAVLGHFWTKNGKTIESTSEDGPAISIEYKLENIDSKSGGLYACVFRIEGGELSENIPVKTVPHVSAYKKQEHGNEGDKGILVCESHGYPLPTDWSWAVLGPDDVEQEITNATTST
ncbi:hypothetical protein AAFF_G00392950 [Aldrovandia affinis]|uniref:Ig-like domain-containing protein n=1 Tax=Aldrovandia affinis TaxID=143900 RepID=A0AAD7R4F2_9TELE|nr:hypothetical protein AAFF_G00392950 [Aldrovandia affinis]